MAKRTYEGGFVGVVVGLLGAFALAGCQGSGPTQAVSAPTGSPVQPVGCALSCGAGRCVVENGAPACACPPERSGARCEQCAPGYQDVDGDGRCLPDCSMMTELHCGRGVCSAATGVPRCACDEGYAGPRCEACAPGYQDHDGDGRCAPDCSLSGVECHGNGTCDDSSGAAACACDPGFAASDCSTCAAGFQDRDGDGVCAPDCASAALGCSGHGSCDDSSGEARCACTAGYQGDACEACAPGAQDLDEDGVCRPSCASAQLSCAVGACSEAGGVARCACTGGYVGAACDRCAAGTQDLDGDGVCLPACAGGAFTCSGRTWCDDSSGQPQCVCQPGYVARNGSCELHAPVTSWQGAQPTATGGRIAAEEACHASPGLLASVSLPLVSAPDAFALSATVTSPGDPYFPSESRGLARVGGALAWLDASAAGASTTVCLGEGAQDGSGVLQLSGGALSAGGCDSFTHGALEFEQVQVVASASCPRPGLVSDGRFDEGAWTLFGQAAITWRTTPALSLWMNDGCSLPRASTLMSVPTRASLPNAALRFKMRGTAGEQVELGVGLAGPGRSALHPSRLEVVANGGDEVVTRCLPGWTAGSVAALELTLHGDGVCTRADGRQFFFDDFELVSDPTCAGSTAGLFNPSFEGELEQHWELAVSGAENTDAPEAGPGLADSHSGGAALRLSNARPCFSAAARQAAVVPAGLPSAGPAVVAWYKAGTLDHSAAVLGASVLGAAFEQSLPAASEWQRTVLCLPREMAGLPVLVEARHSGEQGFCSDTFAREEALFDDVEVTVDPSCP